MDARCAKEWERNGVYSLQAFRAEMPARVEEVHHAEEEGIIF